MRRGTLRNSAWTVAAFGIAVALMACGSSSDDPNSIGGNPNDPNNPNNPNGQNNQPKTPEEQVKQILDQRQYDYGEALRTASLKLRDELPTLDEIKQIEAAPDNAAKKAAYEKLVDAMIADVKFNKVMVKFWKDTFRTGQVGQVQQNRPNMDTAANFAARIVVDGKPYTDLFTATDNTCPTFDPATGAFTDGTCGQTPTVGVLTDPGILAQYFSNMAFRRVRFIQETFACSKFPAEYSKTPVPMGNGTYTGTLDFNQITGKKNTPNARIDFQDTSAVICANCHANLNRMAPSFINYDANGKLQATSQVEVPIPGTPKAAPGDYLQSGVTLAWRAGKDYTDIAGLGKQIAEDPEVARCAVNRVWNYAMSRGDIVNDLATVPNAVTDAYVKDFQGGGYKLKETIRAVFKSEDFTKF
jgi:hypothetical protein